MTTIWGKYFQRFDTLVSLTSSSSGIKVHFSNNVHAYNHIIK